MTTEVITTRNVNTALSDGLAYLLKHGTEQDSRNGKVLVAPGTVVTEYTCPWERVLYSPVRNANPFFHLFESLWMLAGHNDIAFPAYFNKRFIGYSDDGVLQHGAYGFRWRNWFGIDQLNWVVEELRRDNNSRRAVIAMWDGDKDPRMVMAGGVDVPCNTHAYFDIREGLLNMTVCCRSNDVIWGAYGANAVHFSFLQEYLAARIGVGMGVYRQVSNNFHVYLSTYPREVLEILVVDGRAHDYYSRHGWKNSPTRHPLFVGDERNDSNAWDFDLHSFLRDPSAPLGARYKFVTRVAAPAYQAWRERKEGISDGMGHAVNIGSIDWKRACVEWIVRAEAKKGGNDGSPA